MDFRFQPISGARATAQKGQIWGGVVENLAQLGAGAYENHVKNQDRITHNRMVFEDLKKTYGGDQANPTPFANIFTPAAEQKFLEMDKDKAAAAATNFAVAAEYYGVAKEAVKEQYGEEAANKFSMTLPAISQFFDPEKHFISPTKDRLKKYGETIEGKTVETAAANVPKGSTPEAFARGIPNVSLETRLKAKGLIEPPQKKTIIQHLGLGKKGAAATKPDFTQKDLIEWWASAGAKMSTIEQTRKIAEQKKSQGFDLTPDETEALGYSTGQLKKQVELFKLSLNLMQQAAKQGQAISAPDAFNRAMEQRGVTHDDVYQWMTADPTAQLPGSNPPQVSGPDSSNAAQEDLNAALDINNAFEEEPNQVEPIQ